MPLVGHDEYCICLLHVSKIFCWPRSLLSMHLMCTIAGHDLHFTCLVYASKVFVRFICLQIAKFSIEYSLYMHHSSFVPFKYAFSWPRFPLYLPCICIIALLSNLYAFSCPRSPLYQSWFVRPMCLWLAMITIVLFALYIPRHSFILLICF